LKWHILHIELDAKLTLTLVLSQALTPTLFLTRDSLLEWWANSHRAHSTLLLLTCYINYLLTYKVTICCLLTM